MRVKLEKIAYSYIEVLIENYNQTALLINACDKALTYYHSKSSKLALDTTKNIPNELKLSTDITSIYNKKDLITQYNKELMTKLAKDYLITTVVTLDGLMEDIYEQILIFQETDKTEEQIKRMIGWRENQLPYDIIERIPNLKIYVNAKGHKLEEFFYTYEHLRQIRHAIIHCQGKLQQRHLRKMTNLEEKMNIKQRESMKQFYQGERVNVNHSTTFLLRHWCLTFMSFLTGALLESIDK